MKIEVLQSCTGVGFSFSRGIHETTKEIAEPLIKGGLAREVKGQTESATKQPPENATSNPKPEKRTAKK